VSDELLRAEYFKHWPTGSHCL